jgi:hypothetical protein
MKLTSVERKLAKLEAAVDALPSQRKRVLVAIVDDTDDEAVKKGKMEKALAEHVARHPEDFGRTVADFNWILQQIVRSFRGWHDDPQCAAGIETSGDG